jgi:phosphoketolase
MTSKQFPNDFIELKSLIADLKSFRLEEYAINAQEKRKLTQIHSELKDFYNNDETQIPIDSNHDLNAVNKLWEKLDASLHMREILLEKSIEKYFFFVTNQFICNIFK